MAKTSLILDFGGVIAKTVFEQHRRTERLLGLTQGVLSWLGPLDPRTDEPRARVERGEMTERAYWVRRAAEVGRLVGQTWDVDTFFRGVQGDDANAVIRPQAVTAVRRLRASGVRLAVLSNELERFFGPDVRSRIDLLSDIDVIVDGSGTGVRKPDPRAYELCLKELGASAAEAIFVDDQRGNVEGARRLGIDAMQFDVRHPARCFAEIERLFRLGSPA